MEKAESKNLKQEVAAKYQVIKNHGVGEYHWSGHRVHLDLLDLATADKLVAEGFPYLVPVNGASEKKKLTDGAE